MRLLRRSLTGLLALFLFACTLGAGAPAHAEDGYRYWGYFQWNAQAQEWRLAQTGAAEYVPKDGAVDGWRFAVNVGLEARPPRATGDFATICADTSSEAGEKRVAVVIDYGLPEDAPDGEEPPAARGACAVVPSDASSAQVLQAVAQVRINNTGLTCGIDGYPAGECAPKLKDVSVPAEDEPVELTLSAPEGDAAGFPWAPVAVGVVALAIGAGAVLALRRRA